MEILKPNSSMPAAHDGLRIYSGKYSVSGGNKTIRITTLIRQSTFINIYAIPNVGYGDVPTFDGQYVQLGYLENTNTQTGEYYFDVKVPDEHTLYYFIVGSQDKNTISTREVSPSAASVLASRTYLEALIVNAGTSATEFLNSTGKTMTYSKLSTGIYKIVPSAALFSDTKTFGHVSIKQGSTSFAGSSWTIHWYIISSTDLRMVVYENTNDGGGLVDVADLPTNAQILLSLSFKSINFKLINMPQIANTFVYPGSDKAYIMAGNLATSATFGVATVIFKTGKVANFKIIAIPMAIGTGVLVVWCTSHVSSLGITTVTFESFNDDSAGTPIGDVLFNYLIIYLPDSNLSTPAVGTSTETIVLK